MDGRDAAEAMYGEPEKATSTMSADKAQDLFDHNRSEEELHRACVRWADAQSGALPELDALFHPPNGGARTAKEGARMKKMGVKAGVPDLCLPIVRPVTWTNGTEVAAGALWVELKSESGRLRDTQRRWRARLMKHQHCYVVCRSLGDFQAAVTDYIAGDFAQETFDQ
jgi:hypothetical protein